MKMLFSEVKQKIIKHEGLRLKLYRCPAGKLTIGVGRNIEDNGIREDEADLMLENDIKAAEQDVRALFAGYDNLTPVRQYVLIDMCFNVGRTRLAGFKKMFAALAAQDYKTAAAEMLDSAWARQVPVRAIELSKLMEAGN